MVFAEITLFRKTIVLSIIIGVISGFGAYLFYTGIELATHFIMGDIFLYSFPAEGMTAEIIANWAPPENIWLFLPIICTGALISGILVCRFAPEAEGHGTDAAISAFHTTGRIRRRVPLIKALASIATIATGGSAGQEGPTAQIAAGFGSIAADILHLPEKERRIAIAAGIGAGIGTIFKAPLGGAILAIEVLYLRDFESEAIIPAFLSSVIGYAIFGFFEGYDPIFAKEEFFWSVPEIPLFILLGIVCAAVGIAYVKVFQKTGKAFKTFWTKHNLPPDLKPITGAAAIGLIFIAMAYYSKETFLIALGSIGPGYGFIQLALYNMLPLSALILIPFVRIITTSLTIGSGGSGGVFAPGLTIGAITGGAFGTIMHILLPDLVPLTSVPIFVICGMIALFGGVSHAPVACLIMIIEMVGDFSIFVPAMGAVAVSVILIGNNTIFGSQVLNKSLSGAHRGEYDSLMLRNIRAEEAMTPERELTTVTPDTPCNHLISLIEKSTHYGYPVVENRALLGFVTLRDYKKCKQNSTIRSVMQINLITVNPQSDLEKVFEMMMTNDLGHIPVVEIENKVPILVGVITRRDISRIYAKQIKNLEFEDQTE